MRLDRALGLLAWIKFRRWNRAWKDRATLLDNAALATLAAAGTYNILTMIG